MLIRGFKRQCCRFEHGQWFVVIRRTCVRQRPFRKEWESQISIHPWKTDIHLDCNKEVLSFETSQSNSSRANRQMERKKPELIGPGGPHNNRIEAGFTGWLSDLAFNDGVMGIISTKNAEKTSEKYGWVKQIWFWWDDLLICWHQLHQNICQEDRFIANFLM